jgi:hypothetical protein
LIVLLIIIRIVDDVVAPISSVASIHNDDMCTLIDDDKC